MDRMDSQWKKLKKYINHVFTWPIWQQALAPFTIYIYINMYNIVHVLAVECSTAIAFFCAHFSIQNSPIGVILLFVLCIFFHSPIGWAPIRFVALLWIDWYSIVSMVQVRMIFSIFIQVFKFIWISNCYPWKEREGFKQRSKFHSSFFYCCKLWRESSTHSQCFHCSLIYYMDDDWRDQYKFIYGNAAMGG